jgi:hypothetical protein
VQVHPNQELKLPHLLGLLVPTVDDDLHQAGSQYLYLLREREKKKKERKKKKD